LCGNFSKPPLYDETFEKMANLKKMLKMRRAYAPRTIQKIREILIWKSGFLSWVDTWKDYEDNVMKKKPNRNRKIETFEPFPEKEKQYLRRNLT